MHIDNLWRSLRAKKKINSLQQWHYIEQEFSKLERRGKTNI